MPDKLYRPNVGIALFNAAGHAGDDFSGIINFLRGEK